MNRTFTSESKYPQWLDREEYPFTSNYIQLPVGRMHYVDHGEGDPIVMVHGNPAWSFEYRKLIRKLSETHRCIAMDHIGFGLSEKPKKWNYLPAEHAINFEILMDKLDLSVITLVVNDWGGPIGLAYAIKYPEKFKRLIILNTFLWPVRKVAHFKAFSYLMGSKLGKYLILNHNFFGKVVIKFVVGYRKHLHKAIHRHYYQHLGTKSDRIGSYVFPREIIGSSDWLESLWQDRKKINHLPTTFIWGMKDPAFRPAELDKWIRNWDAAKVIKLEEAGHFPQEEAPWQVIEAIKSEVT